MPRYTISIAIHDNLDLTRRCLDSIFTHSPAKDYEIIVTDNASTDGSHPCLLELTRSSVPCSRLEIVHNDRNAGFGEAHNHALTLATGQFFVVLNNDLEVTPGWLELLAAEFARNPRLAIVGVRGTCCSLDDNALGRPGTTLEYIEASCLMIPTALARRHGLFDEAYRFAYLERIGTSKAHSVP